MHTITITRSIVTLVTLERSLVKNAFNDLLIEELTKTAIDLSKDPDIRVIVLTGAGDVFCAGADVHWMKSMINYSFEENKQDSLKMAEMFKAIASSPKPWIARVNGHAIGGGAGLVAACDIAVSIEDAKFGFTEARLGILPAVISPHVIPKIGLSYARRYFITGEIFNSQKALEIGLIHEVANDSFALDDRINKLSSSLLKSSPNAIAGAKDLLSNVPNLSLDEAIPYTVEMIASHRISNEGQEGLLSFLEKRTPSWVSSLPSKWI